MLDFDNSRHIVKKALRNLNEDPDIRKGETKFWDERTLERGFFHASEDSKNAHSWLCRSINKHLSGEFNYGYFDQGTKVKEDAYEASIQYLGILIASSRKKVKVQFEQHTIISKAKIESILKSVNQAVIQGAYQSFAIPKFFPEVEIEIVDKSNAGVQVVDFLLWANNRTLWNKPDRVWANRLQTITRINSNIPDWNSSQGGMVFKKPIRSEYTKFYPKNIFPLPELKGTELLVKIFDNILSEVVKVLNEGMPNHLKQLNEYREQLFSKLVESDFILHSDLVVEISNMYLRLFDMKPVFTQEDKEDVSKMQMLLQAKRFAGLLVRCDLMHGTRSRQFISDCFRESLKVSYRKGRVRS